jgi:hypothetical protein
VAQLRHRHICECGPSGDDGCNNDGHDDGLDNNDNDDHDHDRGGGSGAGQGDRGKLVKFAPTYATVRTH